MLTLIVEDRTWLEVADHLLTDVERKALSALPTTILLSEVTLFEALSFSRAKDVKALLYPNVQAEINRFGKRRCVWLHGQRRCNIYSNDVVCEKHREKAAMISNLFKSPALSGAFNHYLSSPEKHSLDNEIALQRTMLHVLLQRIDDGNMTMQDVMAVTALCDKISSVVERSAKLNQITPESVNKLLTAVVDVIAEFVPPEKLAEAAARIEEVNPMKSRSAIPYEPSDDVKIKDLHYQIEGAKSSLQKRALLETAQHMSIEDEDGTRPQ